MTRLLTHVDRLHEYQLGLFDKDNLGIGEVNKFIVHIHNLIKANTFDDSVLTQHMNSAVNLLCSD